MSDFRLDMGDEAFDELLRGEMAVLRDTAAVPALRLPDLRPRRPRLLPPGDPAHPRRLAPAALALGLAVLVAVGGGTWYSVGRLHGRAPAPAATPQPSPPAPTPPIGELPARLPSTVPPGVQVVYYTTYAGQPHGALRLEAVDWSGTPRGHIDVPGYTPPPNDDRPLALLQSPDGERLAVTGKVYASDGHFLFTVPVRDGTVTWGDDSRSLCVLTRELVPGTQRMSWELTVVGPDGAARPVVSVLGEVGLSDRFEVNACSVSRDVVVATWYESGVSAFVRVSRMSSNQQLFTQDWVGSGPVNAVAVSADGRYAAASDITGQVYFYDLAAYAFRKLAEHGTVVQLSGDGSHLLIGVGGDRQRLEVVAVPKDNVVYDAVPANIDEKGAGGQPGGPGLAYTSFGQPPTWLNAELQRTFEIFRETGSSSEGKVIAHGVWTTWFHIV